MARTSVRSFLASAKSALHAAIEQSRPVTLVIGNESADLDSLCSAIVLAYLQTHRPPVSTGSTTLQPLYIPLSNLVPGDLELRSELLPVLRHARLQPSDLITLADLPALAPSSSPKTTAGGGGRAGRLRPEDTRWLLVDHNSLQGELGRLYRDRVVGCIDHHEDEKQIPVDDRPEGLREPRVIEPCGSCSSLVVAYGREAWDRLAQQQSSEGIAGENGESAADIDAELARLALAPVLVDTTRLTSKGKTKPVDRSAVEYLESWITAAETGKEYTRETYFDEITRAKEDIGGLALRDILRKDYKQWTEGDTFNLGIVSVVKPIAFLAHKANDSRGELLQAIESFSRERHLALFAIMTTSHAGGVFTRELLLWAMTPPAVAAAQSFDRNGAVENLGLETWDEGSLDLDSDGQWRRCWMQKKVEHSRKQVAPLLRTAIGDVLS